MAVSQYSMIRGQTAWFDFVPRDRTGALVPQSSVSKAWFYVKANKTDADAIAIIKKTYSPQVGIAWVTDAVDVANGNAQFPGFRVTLDSADTDVADITTLGKAYWCEMQYTDSAGKPHKLDQGELWIDGDVVQARV